MTSALGETSVGGPPARVITSNSTDGTSPRLSQSLAARFLPMKPAGAGDQNVFMDYSSGAVGPPRRCRSCDEEQA